MKLNATKAAAALLAVAMMVGCGSAASTSQTAASEAASSEAASSEAASSEDAVSSATAQTYKGFASAPGFAAHGDVAFANAEVDAEGNLVALEINEYYGIRSVGRIVNNLEKAKDDELQKVNAIDELIADVNADTTDKYLDLVSGATFGYPSLYVNVAQAAVENALASK
jgi:hypothetical protein